MLKSLLLAACGVVAASAASAATLNASASTEFTMTIVTTANATGIAYDPTNGLYYGGRAGNASYDGQTWDATGAMVSTDTLGIDIRGVWYNPNTAEVEVNTYSSGSGGPNRGIVTANRDASGNWAGSGTTEVSPVSGIASAQSVVDYDAGRNVLYSRSAGNVVNVIDRNTGALSSQVTLAGLSATTQDHSIGYIEALDAFVTLDVAAAAAEVFDINGALLGSVDLLGLTDPNSGFGMAYENGLLFVHDRSIRAWRAYDIVDGEGTVSPVPLPAGMPLILLGLGAFGLMRARRD